MKISLIAAMSQNCVIGRDNQLPWHLPNDLKRFKALTLGKPIIMGPKTFESIGKPLPNRKNIVLTHDKSWAAEYWGGKERVPQEVLVTDTLENALKAAQEANLGDEVMVIGGGGIYQSFLPLAHRLYLTLVQAKVAGDTTFPEIDFSEWQEIEAESHPKDVKHEYDYRFVILEKFSG